MDELKKYKQKNMKRRKDMNSDLNSLAEELDERQKNIDELLHLLNKELTTYGCMTITEKNFGKLVGVTCECRRDTFIVVSATIEESQEIEAVLIGKRGEIFKVNYQGQWTFQSPVVTGQLGAAEVIIYP